jgi:hypothetical protein
MPAGDKGASVDTTFWVGIGIGAVLSLFASIAANLFHSRINAYLDKRKLVSHEKRKRNALRLHKVIVDLHEGTRDKTFYLLRISTGLIVSALMLISALCSAVVLLGLMPAPATFDEPIRPHISKILGILILGFFAGFGTMLLSIISNELRAVESALGDYVKYLSEFKERWGDDAAGVFPPREQKPPEGG